MWKKLKILSERIKLVIRTAGRVLQTSMHEIVMSTEFLFSPHNIYTVQVTEVSHTDK